MFSIRNIKKILGVIIRKTKELLQKFHKSLTLNSEELNILSNFLIEVAKGILGVPIVIYFISGFSVVALILGFMLDLVVVLICLMSAIKLRRAAKRKND